VIALDTNLLVYAHRSDALLQREANELLPTLAALNELPQLDFIGEGENYLERLADVALPARVASGAIHYARIAAICKYHGVRELWSADRDFSRFPQLKTHNPLLPRA